MIGVIKFPRRLPDLTGYGSLCTLANLRACTNLWHELVQVTSHISRPERNPYNKWSLLKTPRSKGGSRGFTRCGSSCVRKSCKCELLKTSIAQHHVIITPGWQHLHKNFSFRYYRSTYRTNGIVLPARTETRRGRGSTEKFFFWLGF